MKAWSRSIRKFLQSKWAVDFIRRNHLEET